MTEDTKYVLRHEWERNTGKIYEKINQNEIKYNEKFAELNTKIEKQTDLQQRTLESQERQEKFQERQEKNQEKLNETMENFANDFVDIKYQVKGHEEKIASVQGVLDEKEKGNQHLIGVVITGVFGVIIAAIGAAQYLF